MLLLPFQATLRHNLQHLPETARRKNVDESVVSTSLTANVIFASAPVLVPKAASADKGSKALPVLNLSLRILSSRIRAPLTAS